MIVDDDAMNIQVLQSMLQVNGYQTDACMDGYTALNVYQERIKKFKSSGLATYQIVFLDYSMPGMDGPEFCSQLLQILRDEAIEAPYICCCTAYGEVGFK